MALKLNEQYPGRFDNPSTDYPQGSFKNRTTPTSEDGSYFEKGWANDQLAFFSSLLSSAGVAANGQVDKVGSCQTYDALLSVIAATAKNRLDTVRIDVASASNINLTTSAPNTSHINITGTTTINGFALAAGQCYFVRFAGALTLTNSASLVTQLGADILTAAGDTCVIRATAANVVEVLSYSAVPRGVLGATGWRKVDHKKGGFIEQWGVTTVASVTFPIPFPNALLDLNLLINDYNSTASNAGQYMSSTAKSITGFTVAAASGGPGAAGNLKWFARGN